MILGIETSSILCSLAWYENGRILLEYNIEKNQIHSTLLAELFNKGLHHLDKSINDISLAAIAIGPGSYTGVRIGMSFTKGLCYGSEIPIIGVSNFNVLALQTCINEMPLITLIDAHKGQFYYAKFTHKDKDFSDSGILEFEILNQYSNKETGVILDYYTKIDIKNEPWKNFAWVIQGRFNASYLCQAAEKKYNKYGTDDINDLEPLYLQAFAGIL
jgi:tRNA threonylcarbamoyladenosine biosynthesis protein TsaB